ncbi:MAG: hypothetical protein U1E60_07440 [Reyranellaceae bacterium]
MLVANAALRGPWLDEFWTLRLSDSSDGVRALVRDGWMRDTHPPVFNAWATLLGSIGVSSIASGRIVSNLLAAGLMSLAALRFGRRRPDQAGFAAALLLLTLSLPQAMDAFVTYRSYFWQMAAMATLAIVARHVASTRHDLALRDDLEIALIAVVASGASIGLHYVGGLFGALLSGAIVVCALVRGLRRWAILVFAAAVLSGLFMLAMALVQAPHWLAELDHSWIDTPLLAAFVVPLTLGGAALWHNPVVFAGLWKHPRRLVEGDRPYLFVIAGSLAASIALVLALHAVMPIVIDRYLFAVPVMVCALMAAPAARLAGNRPMFALLAFVSVAATAVTLADDGIKPLWRENAQVIAEIVRECPSTRVYAASGWALGPAAETLAARREDPVFARAYRALAEQHGYTVSFIGQSSGARATPGRCPVLLWVEHTPNEAESDLPEALSEARLAGLEEAQLSVHRSATGFVVRADR